MTDVLIRVVAPHFVAGAILRDDACVEAAPIIRYMAIYRWSYWRVLSYCAEKRWELEVCRL
jgi:hypothetical protein